MKLNVLPAYMKSFFYRIYLKQLLLLRDLVVHLTASRAEEGPPRHLLERLVTATREQSHHTRKTSRNMSYELKTRLH